MRAESLTFNGTPGNLGDRKEKAMSIRELLPRLAVFSLVTARAILSLPTPAIAQPSAQNSGFTVFAPNSKPYGLTIGEWSARWWEWVLSIPPGSNPQLD